MCQLNCLKYFHEQCPNYLSEVFDVATKSNIELRGGYQKLKCPFRKINKCQFAFSYIGPTFWSKTLDALNRTNNLKVGLSPSNFYYLLQ